MTFPRVLHVGFDPIGAPTNSGLTLKSMFGDWPQENLLQLAMPSRQDFSAIPNLILAPASIAPVDGAIRKALGKRLPAGTQDGLSNAIGRAGRQIPFKSKAKLQAAAANDAGPTWVSAKLVHRIELFRPDVLHSLLGGVRTMRLAIKLSDRLGIPIVPHFMDDWSDTLFTDGQILGLARRTVEHNLDEIIRRSPLCLTIGSDMQREYSTRFGRQCVVVGNSVNFADFPRLDWTARSGDSPLRMRYVGGLHLGREASLRRVAKLLEQRAQTGQVWSIEIFVPPNDTHQATALASSSPSIQFGGTLSPNEIPGVLSTADALIFLESSDPNIHRFTRLSVSTKVPQYMAAGRPVLVVGPEDQGSVNALMQGSQSVMAGDGTDVDRLHFALNLLEEHVTDPLEPRTADNSAWLHESFGNSATRARLKEALQLAVSRGQKELVPR